MPLAPELETFVRGEVSISVAAADASGRSSLVRVLGVRPHADAQGRLTLILDRDQAAELLAMVASSGRVAVVFSEPHTHRTVQIKSADARAVAVDADDAAHCRQHLRDFARALAAIGWPEPDAFTAALLPVAADRLAAIAFSPAAVFEQTPGPAAGARIGGLPPA